MPAGECNTASCIPAFAGPGQIATIDSLKGAYLAGEASEESVLAGMKAAALAEDLDVLMAGVDLACTLRPFIPRAERGSFGSLVVKVFGSRLAQLSRIRRPKPEQSRAVSDIPRLLAAPEMDAAVRAKLIASARAEIGLGKGAPFLPDLRREAFCAATEDGGRPVFDVVLAKATASADQLYRQQAFAGIGCGADTLALRQAVWEVVGTKRLSPPDLLYIVFSNTSDPDHTDDAWAAAEPHIAEFVEALCLRFSRQSSRRPLAAFAPEKRPGACRPISQPTRQLFPDMSARSPRPLKGSTNASHCASALPAR